MYICKYVCTYVSTYVHTCTHSLAICTVDTVHTSTIHCSDVGAVQRRGSCAATWELCSDVGVVQRRGELCSAISSLGTGQCSVVHH